MQRIILLLFLIIISAGLVFSHPNMVLADACKLTTTVDQKFKLVTLSLSDCASRNGQKPKINLTKVDDGKTSEKEGAVILQGKFIQDPRYFIRDPGTYYFRVFNEIVQGEIDEVGTTPRFTIQEDVVPPPQPPPGGQPPPGQQPPPASGGAIDFSKLEQAVGLNVGGKTTGITLGDIVTRIVPILFVIAGLVLLLYLIWGGFSLMLSKGDPKAVEAAKGRITNAIIGFVIIFIAYWLVQLLGLVFGIAQFGDILKK